VAGRFTSALVKARLGRAAGRSRALPGVMFGRTPTESLELLDRKELGLFRFSRTGLQSFAISETCFFCSHLHHVFLYGNNIII
jgi:hypothetical protein